MSTEVAQPPSPPRSIGSRSHADQLSPYENRKLEYHHHQQRSDETNSIGYGSCAPQESESSYSSHGYPPPPPAILQQEQQQQILATNFCNALKNTMVLKNRTAAISSQQQPSTNLNALECANGDSCEFVVDSDKGNAYYKGQLLGKGGFAKVYLITDIRTKNKFACKIIAKHQMQNVYMQKIAREVMIHRQLNHVNVVKMHHYFEDCFNAYMLLEACPKKSLMHVLKYRGKVTEPEARYYMKQMISGVSYIHSQKVVHRDLKPSNMFLSDKMIVKIGDFGLATQPNGQKRRVTLCGTPNYIAPEVLLKQSYSFEADVWALGCILYVLLVGHPPFDSSSLEDTYARIRNNHYRELDDTQATRAGQDLVRWLLLPEPDLRPLPDAIKEHPYLSREYSPQSLPDTCCYQAPTSFPDIHYYQQQQYYQQRLSGSLGLLPIIQTPLPQNFYQQQQLQLQQQQQQQQQYQYPTQTQQQQILKPKRKVSSWISGFKHRIGSVLCIDKRKKQQQILGSAPNKASACLLMSRALEECLTAKATRLPLMPPRVPDRVPLFVTKWIDYSNKHGLAFQLSDMSMGVLFNDNTKMSYTRDRKKVEYITADDVVTRYNREKNVPAHLHDKLDLIRHFADYMDVHLTEGGEISEKRGNRVKSRSQKNECIPQMRRWLRTSKAIIMEMNVPLLQMNFFEDHTKLIVSQDSETHNYLVTYVDCGRRALTYWLHDLRDYGCAPELRERLLYIYKVAKEFSELDVNINNNRVQIN